MVPIWRDYGIILYLLSIKNRKVTDFLGKAMLNALTADVTGFCKSTYDACPQRICDELFRVCSDLRIFNTLFQEYLEPEPSLRVAVHHDKWCPGSDTVWLQDFKVVTNDLHQISFWTSFNVEKLWLYRFDYLKLCEWCSHLAFTEVWFQEKWQTLDGGYYLPSDDEIPELTCENGITRHWKWDTAEETAGNVGLEITIVW